MNSHAEFSLPVSDHLLVGVAADGLPDGLDLRALIDLVPHRRRVGVICDARPYFLLASSRMIPCAWNLDFAVRTYAPGVDEDVAQLNALELQLALLRRLSNRRIDTVLVVGLTMSPTPIVREIHNAGRKAILAVRTPFVARALRVADAVVDLDAFVAGQVDA